MVVVTIKPYRSAVKIKAAIVSGLERLCTWKDTYLPGPVAGFRGYWLAMLSDRLDQRWVTGVWRVPQDPEAPYRTHWGQASDRCVYCMEPIHQDEYLVWHHTEDDAVFCDVRSFPMKLATPSGDERLQISRDLVAGAWYVRLRAGAVARTVEISDEVMIDLDDDGTMLGLELLCDPDQLDASERNEIEQRFGDDGRGALAAADDARRRGR
jgi:uncharacterized protein YuzE